LDDRGAGATHIRDPVGDQMKFSFAHAGLLAAALFIAGCNDASIEDWAPKAEKQLPEKLVQAMRAKGMTRTSPIMVRIFKEEGQLEVWKQKDNGRYDLAASYDICKWSGKLGPKFTEGDRQAPEGFYDIHPYQMNPKSSYHLSFNIGYPNAFDRVHGRTGSNLMVHGACSSAGCYSMTDEQVEQIYAFARDAFRGGQKDFQVQAFPFRMTPENMARYKGDPNYDFWSNLKEGYDYFQITKVPPKVDVCGRRYVFNQIAANGGSFSPGGVCPPSSQPDTLQAAYRSYQQQFDSAFAAALEGSSSSGRQPSPSIAGFKEATLVADWSRRRARGEKVTREPPSLQQMTPRVAAVPQPRPEPAPQQVVATQAGKAVETAGAKPSAVAAAPQAQADAAAATAPVEGEQPKDKKNWRRLWGLFGGG